MHTQGSERVLGFFEYKDGRGAGVAATQELSDRFQKGLEKCFKVAVDSGGCAAAEDRQQRLARKRVHTASRVGYCMAHTQSHSQAFR